MRIPSLFAPNRHEADDVYDAKPIPVHRGLEILPEGENAPDGFLQYSSKYLDIERSRQLLALVQAQDLVEASEFLALEDRLRMLEGHVQQGSDGPLQELKRYIDHVDPAPALTPETPRFPSRLLLDSPSARHKPLVLVGHPGHDDARVFYYKHALRQETATLSFWLLNDGIYWQGLVFSEGLRSAGYPLAFGRWLIRQAQELYPTLNTPLRMIIHRADELALALQLFIPESVEVGRPGSKEWSSLTTVDPDTYFGPFKDRSSDSTDPDDLLDFLLRRTRKVAPSPFHLFVKGTEVFVTNGKRRVANENISFHQHVRIQGFPRPHNSSSSPASPSGEPDTNEGRPLRGGRKNGPQLLKRSL